MKKILMILADGFEEIEALGTVDVLRRLGFSVTAAGVKGVAVSGAHGISVNADAELAAVDDSEFDAVVLPGGMPGAANLDSDSRVDGILRRAAGRGAVIGAICAAPFILAGRGLVRSGKFTMYPGFESRLNGLKYTDAPAECDGAVVTGRGPGAVFDFAGMLAKRLGAGDACEKLYEEMFVGR